MQTFTGLSSVLSILVGRYVSYSLPVSPFLYVPPFFTLSSAIEVPVPSVELECLSASSNTGYMVLAWTHLFSYMIRRRDRVFQSSTTESTKGSPISPSTFVLHTLTQCQVASSTGLIRFPSFSVETSYALPKQLAVLQPIRFCILSNCLGLKIYNDASSPIRFPALSSSKRLVTET